MKLWIGRECLCEKAAQTQFLMHYEVCVKAGAPVVVVVVIATLFIREDPTDVGLGKNVSLDTTDEVVCKRVWAFRYGLHIQNSEIVTAKRTGDLGASIKRHLFTANRVDAQSAG